LTDRGSNCLLSTAGMKTNRTMESQIPLGITSLPAQVQSVKRRVLPIEPGFTDGAILVKGKETSPD